jgi:hypothetical protein
MAWWKSLARLIAGWGLMLAGVLVMLDANLPTSHARGRTWLAAQAAAGFALVLAGWWLRRAAMRPPAEPR